MQKHYIIGIDEAGRGPWAGPVVAGGLMTQLSHAHHLLESLTGLTDSKKIQHKRREEIFHSIEKMQDENRCQYSFAYRDSERIDEIGIREANRESMQDVILSLLQFTGDADTVEVYIDGCDNYLFDIGEDDIGYEFQRQSEKKRQEAKQRTGRERIKISYHIAGDASIPAISAASIIAKVLRDRTMCEYSEDFPGYGFDSHKGYGTRKHRESLLYYGISPIHRKSYAPIRALISPASSL